MEQKKKQEIRIFIGSSGKIEAKRVAYDAQNALYEVDKLIEKYKIIPRIWCSDKVFKNGEFTLQSLINECENDNAAIFIYNGDDDLIKNGEKLKVTRANVIFEHGLFMGYLGKEKTFILQSGGDQENEENNRKEQTPDIGKILSDYDGVCKFDYNTVQYDKSGLVTPLRKWIETLVICKSTKDDFRITASIVESHGFNDNRNSEFQELYGEAQAGDSIKVLGLGVTNFLNGEYIDDLLDLGVNISVLLMHDKIIKNDGDCEFEKLVKELPPIEVSIKEDSCPVTLRNVLIDKSHFGDYQHRQNNSLYLDKMRQAYANCAQYEKAYPNLFNYNYFYSFIPMSMTAFQQKGGSKTGKLIVEFIIPFTKNRILLKVSEEENKIVFDTFMNFYDNIEKQSKKHRN